jgi:predicted nuclease with TOPRIM domain
LKKSKSVTKYDPRKIWPTKLLPDYEKELRAMRDQLDEASKAFVKLVQQNTSVKKEIDRYKSELEYLDTENSSFTKLQCTEEDAIQETPLPKNQFAYLDKVVLPNEVLEMNQRVFASAYSVTTTIDRPIIRST